MAEVEWLIEYGNTLSVIGLLLIILFVALVGLYRRWWVPGWMYTDLISKHALLEGKYEKLQIEAEREAERVRIRMEVLEESLLPKPRTRRTRE